MNETLKIRSVIVDDEPGTLDRLRGLIADCPEIELVKECSDGHQAIEAIRLHSPDLVFLDVEMPEINGFAVLESVAQHQQPPVVIFVTAFDKYACQAFEVAAVDFLHKPFDQKRFKSALEKAKEKLAAGRSVEMIQRLLALLEKASDTKCCLERLTVKANDRSFFLAVDEIDWIEADEGDVLLHVGRESYEYGKALCWFEAGLDRRKFRRIHRSTIVNVGSVKEIVPWFNGHLVILKDSTELHLSRDYRKNLMDF